ncbi:hypothetical protein [Prosthecobacter sp.]|uniref:hypothetical protein n=1 Tax=Prosthecobacter sp. TaxID=1965333 RepID=UPI001D9092C5|nr:hypothetical protein [Prosthecobacter sp.]MCB1276074.1 hypothetical protein [Prosthecobacter sp.]
MTRHRARTTSQTLAATVTFVAVLIMLTPLRRGPAENHSRQAGWTPLLNVGGMADTAAFRRLSTSSTRFAASDQPLSRQPSWTAKSSSEPTP